MTAAQTTATPSTGTPGSLVQTRAFLVVWQHPQTRTFTQVGRLEIDEGGYWFCYHEDAADVADFEPFLAFPELERTYQAAELFPFFSNRVLSPRRPDYPVYLGRLGLDSPDPVEILARSGGGRATDTVHLVPEPALTSTGCVELRFLASGVRHADPDGAHLATVSIGDVLALREDADNKAKPLALLLDNTSGEPVGWVPDYLLDTVRGLRETYEVQVIADVVNGLDAPAHLRLLCLLRAISTG